MRFTLALLIPFLFCTVARAAGDFTIEWKTLVPNAPNDLDLLVIGRTHVFFRPIPPPREKDPPRFGLFVDKAPATKTLLYPGKWYHFAIVRRDDKMRFFVNGFAEPTSHAATGVIEAWESDMTITEAALSDDEILARFSAQLAKRAITTVGHRGVHLHAPENTRISYVQAIAAKTPIVEIDTALTKDGHIVLMHDKTVDRTTNGKGAVADLTVDEITRLDAGSWKHEKYEGERVPTLAQVAEVCRGKAIMMLDLKAEGQGKAIAEWLAQSRWPHDQLIVAPWTDEEGAALRKHVPADVPMIRLTSKIPTETFDDAYFEKMKQTGFTGFSVNWQYLSDAFVRAAQKAGMTVYVWTINDSPDIAGAALLGVDRIVTDDPAATMKVIRSIQGNEFRGP